MRLGHKFYDNQIFVDVFDSNGRHDRVLDNEDNEDLYENFAELKEKYLLVEIDRSEDRKENTKEAIGNYFMFNDGIVGAREDTLDILRPLSIQRHVNKHE